MPSFLNACYITTKKCYRSLLGSLKMFYSLFLTGLIFLSICYPFFSLIFKGSHIFFLIFDWTGQQHVKFHLTCHISHTFLHTDRFFFSYSLSFLSLFLICIHENNIASSKVHIKATKTHEHQRLSVGTEQNSRHVEFTISVSV